jgi:serine protease Do
MAKEVADQLIDKGRIIRPWLGIGIASLSEFEDLSGNVKEGVVVTEIRRDTPASKSTLKQADIIVGIDGVPVKSPKELQQQVLRKKVGDVVNLEVIRGAKPVTVKIQTAEMTDEVQRASNKSTGKPKLEKAFGLTVQTLTKDLAKQFDVQEAEGVVVTEVADGSLAEQKGLQRGDVITEVDRTAVHSAEQFSAELAKGDPKKGVLLFVKRNGAATFVVLKDAK